MLVYVIENEHPGSGEHRHLPNADGLEGGAALTLCGWVDVRYREEEGTPDCPSCLRIVRYCRSLRLPVRSVKRGD
jgi:hypothetical protein